MSSLSCEKHTCPFPSLTGKTFFHCVIFQQAFVYIVFFSYRVRFIFSWTFFHKGKDEPHKNKKNVKHKHLVSNWSLHTRRLVRTEMISARQLVVSSGSPRQACVYQMEACVCVCVCEINFYFSWCSLYTFIFISAGTWTDSVLCVCACVSLSACVYLCRWTSWRAWSAGACPPCHPARRSGRCRAPCSRSSPSLKATACGSRSAEGWRPEHCRRKERGKKTVG